jgi:hypothetical protein
LPQHETIGRQQRGNGVLVIASRLTDPQASGSTRLGLSPNGIVFQGRLTCWNCLDHWWLSPWRCVDRPPGPHRIASTGVVE